MSGRGRPQRKRRAPAIFSPSSSPGSKNFRESFSTPSTKTNKLIKEKYLNTIQKILILMLGMMVLIAQIYQMPALAQNLIDFQKLNRLLVPNLSLFLFQTVKSLSVTEF